MQKYYFFDDGVEHSSSELAEFFSQPFSDGVIVRGNADALKVTAVSGEAYQINIAAGSMFIGGRLYINTDNLTLTVAHGASKTYNRIVIRADSNNMAISAAVVSGSSLPAPTRTGGVYEMSIAKVTVNASAASISEIADERADATVCGYFSNTTAEAIPAGTVMFYAGTTAPTGWLVRNGDILNIADYPALYAVIGNTYGGNSGAGTFALPDDSGLFIRGNTATNTVGTQQAATEIAEERLYPEQQIRNADYVVDYGGTRINGTQGGYYTHNDFVGFRPANRAYLPIIKY